VTTMGPEMGSTTRRVQVNVIEVGLSPASAIAAELGSPAGSVPLRPSDLAGELSRLGLAARHRWVDSATAAATSVAAVAAGGLVVLVGAEPAAIAALPADARRRVVAVTDPEPEDPRDWTTRAGLLGLVTKRTWLRWSNGMMGASGFFGRPEIAAAAGLVMRDDNGALTDPHRSANLPELLARYLRSCDPDAPAFR
jgi:hypothetical protein